MYHDFFGPAGFGSTSRPTGARLGPPVDILSNLTPNGTDQGAIAAADSACNTVPAGLSIAKGGPHAGRIYAAWIASDPESVGTGCNVTMVQSFHNLFVAWSTDGGASWTPSWPTTRAWDMTPRHRLCRSLSTTTATPISASPRPVPTITPPPARPIDGRHRPVRSELCVPHVVRVVR